MIDFALSEEQLAYRDLARRFAEAEIEPVAAHYDEVDDFPWPVVEKAFRAGLMNINIPEEYGGGGLSVLDGMLVGSV